MLLIVRILTISESKVYYKVVNNTVEIRPIRNLENGGWSSVLLNHESDT